METNYFDPAKSIEGLAQFDQAAANSALTFSANFITQIDALAVSLQTMADTAAAALTTAFSTGAVAMSESVGASILNITTKIQEMQIIGSEALAIFSENAIVTFAAINENFIMQADVLNLKFAETALAIEAYLLIALSNVQLAFANTFSNILTELETKKAEIGEQLLEIEQLFLTTSENAKLGFTDNLTIISDSVISVRNTSVESNSNVVASVGQVDEKEKTLKETLLEKIKDYNTLYTAAENMKKQMQNAIPLFGEHTTALIAGNAATKTAGTASSTAAPKILAIGAGALLVGMAVALVAKTVFNFLKMAGLDTHGVKADDFNLKFEIPGLADGGIPGYGELFIAREAGPEFVGSFGSRNVVMNNNQIVDAVSGGVYDAVRRANAEQSQQPIYLNVEAKVRENVLFDMMETVRAERGVRLSTGGAW